MGTTPLRRFLQSLCNNSCWNYAVFWKLHQQNQLLLMWEDGYFGTSKVEDPIETMFGDSSFRGLDETSSGNAYNQTLGGDSLELAGAYMSTFQYALGDGVIGDVAYTGNNCWVFAGSKSSEEFNTPSSNEHADELLIQFAAGVKTILLLPVIPHGVLQLGSLENIPEDAQMANYIKEEFIAHQNFLSGYSDAFATNPQFPPQSQPSPSPSMSTMMKNFNEFPPSMVNWSTHKSLTKSAGTDIQEPSMGAIEVLEPLQLHELTNLINSEVIESSEPEILMKRPLVSDIGSFLSFPKECELHKALGPVFTAKTNDSFENLSIGSKDVVNSSFTKTNGMLTSGEDYSIQTSGESAISTSFGQTKRKSSNEKSAFKGESSLFSKNVVAPVFFSRVNNQNDSSSPSAISSYEEGVVDELTEEEEHKSKYEVLHHNKGSKPSVGGKRKGKPGNKQKARPRDRQLIQDRLKDLRELVPDGAKCSIDGLLDRTVKHMLFLKSIGDRASKLKQCIQPDGVGSGLKNNRTEVKGSQHGASWAYELGGDYKTCPILVEDLQYPGHMIIEMICDESSRFLEIAEVINGLNLTILNGVTEKRSGNTWARYIVEAPRGFHRLDIFWPLMKLLQQQQHSPISSKI